MVWEAAIVGHEDHYTVGIFTTKQAARSAAARAMLSYRRYHRTILFADYPAMRRSVHYWPRVIAYPLDNYAMPYWEHDLDRIV
jgi:hypothetical protein